MFLTADELAELTGLSRHSAQIRWLNDRGWAHAVNGDGRPVVSRQEAEDRMTSRPVAEPDNEARSDGMVRRCSVYIAIAGGVSGTCKIGVSVRVAARIKTIDASSPVPVALLTSCEFANESEAYACEAALHREFRAYRRAGTEWFCGIDIDAVSAALEERAQ